MDEARKHLLDQFQIHLRQSYETYCDRHGMDRTDVQLITFLIDQDLISAGHIQRYAVLHEFEKIRAERECPKVQAVNALAHRFNISERTVWAILKTVRSVKNVK